MRDKLAGVVIGVGLCIWNAKRKTAVSQEYLVTELLQFIRSSKGHTEMNNSHWTFKLMKTERVMTCSILHKQCVLYAATYGIQHALIEEERYYRAFVPPSDWNRVEKAIDTLILPFFKQERMLYCLEKEKQEYKEQPHIYNLRRQLRVVKERGRYYGDI